MNMRTACIGPLLAGLLLIACDGSRPGDEEAVQAGKEVPSPSTRVTAGPRLHCDSLDGFVFKVTYYVDNRPQGEELMRFVGGKMICDGCQESGLKPGMFDCDVLGPESLAIRTMFVKESALMRRYAFYLTRDGMDGKVDIKGEGDEFTTQAFTGKLAP